MPAATYYQPIEAILDGNCNYEYYSHTENTFSRNNKTRICHVQLNTSSNYNRDIALLIFTIRNQSGAWKIQSEGSARMGPGDMVPLRNAAVKLAKEQGWKFVALAVASEDAPATENISQYIVSIESYTYGNETVGSLADPLSTLNSLGNPDFYRTQITIRGNVYSLAFIKKEKLLDYLSTIDDRAYRDGRSIPVLAESVGEEWSTAALGARLKEMYDNAKESNKSNAICMFGIKYGAVIEENNYSATAITSASGINSSYSAEVSKGIGIYRSIKENEYGIRFYDGQDYAPENNAIAASAFDYAKMKGAGINIIFYGTPGCGKSYYIDHDILGKDPKTKTYIGEYEKENIIRTTFYQDYSNTDFVGQILPRITKKDGRDIVEYVFNPGPFTLAFIQAIRHPLEKVALVIEEINRGNAPAIFGDIFQLLDRDEDCISEYGIQNIGMMDYLNSYNFGSREDPVFYHFDEIKIPGNLYLYATMNTSDQNVFTLDTAFVRRWSKEKIKNSFAKCSFKNLPVPGMPSYSWEEFVTAINKHIAKNLEELQTNEDKQIGVYFVKKSLLEQNDAEKFAYKVFDYLWSDVAKLDHAVFFKPYNTLEDLIGDYVHKGVAVFNDGIFPKKENTNPTSNLTNQGNENES